MAPLAEYLKRLSGDSIERYKQLLNERFEFEADASKDITAEQALDEFANKT